MAIAAHLELNISSELTCAFAHQGQPEAGRPMICRVAFDELVAADLAIDGRRW
jgi:hypothetical protein